MPLQCAIVSWRTASYTTCIQNGPWPRPGQFPRFQVGARVQAPKPCHVGDPFQVLDVLLSACVCLLFFLEVLHHPARLRSEGRHPRHARYSAATYVDSNSGDSSDSERVRGNAVNLVSNTLSCRHRLCASRDFVIQPRLGQRCLQHVVILKVDFGIHLCCTSFRL